MVQVGDLEDHRAGVVHRAGDDDLADLGVQAGDDAVDRGGDRGVREVVAGLGDLGLGGLDVVLQDDQAPLFALQAGDGGGQIGFLLVDLGLQRVDR